MLSFPRRPTPARANPLAPPLTFQTPAWLARIVFSGLGALCFCAVSSAGVVGYYRFPTIHGDRVVFSAEGDLWEAPTSGGMASRITTHPGNEAFAKFSPDGKWLAFSAEYEGNVDVYVMPADGGEPRRLTFHPMPDEVIAWKADSSAVVFRSRRESPNRDLNIFEVSREGGQPRKFDFGACALADFSPDGKKIAFVRFSWEMRTWKRYTGGTAQDVWIGDLDTNKFSRMTTWDGTDAFPMWIGDRVFYASDRSSTMNIFSSKPDGTDIKQVTQHDDFDVRWPDSDGKNIVYMHGGDLWIVDAAGGKPHKIDIQLPSDRIRQRERVENANSAFEFFDIDQEGKRLVLGARGELWTTPTKPGRIVQLTNTSGIRERLGAISPDGKHVACISDESGEQEIWLLDAAGKEKPRQLTKRGKGWLFRPVWAPDGKHIVYADMTMTLLAVNVESGETRELDKSENAEITQYTISPDSRWLAYSKMEDNWLSSVFVCDLEDGKPQRVTTEYSNDFAPAWDPKGKYLYFISNRAINPIMDDFDFQHLTTRSGRPCLAILAKTGKSPFLPEELLEEPRSEDDKKSSAASQASESDKDKDKKAAEKKEPVKVVIDFDDLESRIVEFPVPADNYAGISGIDGKALYVTFPTPGLLGGDDHADDDAPQTTLRAYDFKKRKSEVYVEKLRDFTLSGDAKRMAWRVKDEILVAAADSKPGNDIEEKFDPGKLPLRIRPSEEWKQIFDECWRLQRDFYWTEDMAKVDWPKMREKYGALLPRISTRNELSDLLGQLVGELGTSHTYIWGGDVEAAKGVNVGLLGADIRFDAKAGRFQIARVLRPEVWETYIASPLTQTHAHVQDGEYLFAINGRDLGPGDSVEERLTGLAGAQVLLTVGAKADRSDARDVQIAALGNDQPLRYRDWIRRNREYVDQKSGGHIGYFHLPDMGGPGMLEFIKGFYPQHKKDALLIDIRYNGGGFVSQMMIERLARKNWAFMRPRRGLQETYPARVHVGPKVVLINQHSGSDGDIFPESFKIRGLGPLIGMRTWGGVVGIRGDKRFIDGGTSTQPEFAWWEPKRGWGLENRGVEPDIELDYLPEDYVAGRDPQIDRGIAELEKMLKADPPKKPEAPPAPDKSHVPSPTK